MARVTTKELGGNIIIAPLILEHWDDLVAVFGDGRGVCSQCWCMYWRMPRREFETSLGDTNRKLFRKRVTEGPPPGLIPYVDNEPVGWVQVGPRADVPNWNGARRFTAPTPEAPADNPDVWGISCFTTKAGWRRRGIGAALLAGAVEWAREAKRRFQAALFTLSHSLGR